MTRAVRIALVAYRGAQQAALLGLNDMLRAAAQLHLDEGGRRRLEVHTEAGAPWVAPERPLEALVLPPSVTDTPRHGVPQGLADWLRARHAEGTTLCSVCVGAFVLAELGFLDGRPATTHWGLKGEFERRHPEVQLDTSRILVDDGDVLTAGGLMAWVDLALALIARYLGPSTMLATARMFLVDPGGREQRFYATFTPELTHGDQPILRVQRWLQGRAAEETSVREMAAEAGLHPRTFLRRFQRATGLKTGEYLQRLRVAKARELLERTSHTLEQVAWTVGYADPGAFRRVFVRVMGLSPNEYRRRFSGAI